jgi:tRNA uridine 5-carboxymethylaminomethyl modification enzyme
LERSGQWSGPAERRIGEIEVRYEGYIQQQAKEAERVGRAGALRIPQNLDYSRIEGLSREVREKLARIRPADLGMAARIPGVTPAAVSILRLYLELDRHDRN